MKELRSLNFDQLISVGLHNADFYTFDDYRNNGFEHKPITGYCVSCEEKRCHIANDDDASFKLTNISHGAHSSDFFSSLSFKPNIKDWHLQPIMFVYDTPSRDYGIYREVYYHGYRKHPARDWCWIHGEQEPVSYPLRFRGGEYGGFVLSAIQTFKLANVYVTNLVKCGISNEEGKFKSLASYQDETVANCFTNFLKKEIAIFKPTIIFAVGATVEAWIKQFVKEAYYVQQLPHPAGRRRLRDEHYRAIYYWVVARALHKSGIIDTDEGSELAKYYLDHYDT